MSEHSWSESDDDLLPNTDGNVLLGLPDGIITEAADLVDPIVSRLGGTPAFLPLIAVPSHDISYCYNCSIPMGLLVQLWSPFEDSPMDRVLYVWGCARAACQRKDGSVRAFRSLRRNKQYALELQKQKEAAHERLRIAEQLIQKIPSHNPFSRSAMTIPMVEGAQPFGQGNLFKSPVVEAIEPTSDIPVLQAEGNSSPLPEDPALNELSAALMSTTLSNGMTSPAWLASPTYVPLYISTSVEYITPEPQKTHPDPSPTTSGDAMDNSVFEAYESTMGDVVFQRFARRVSNEGHQCVRYELLGAPLPYQADAVYERLFPRVGKDLAISASTNGTIGFAGERSYNASSIPACPVCKGLRVFECQLMPNILNVLKSSNPLQSAGTGGLEQKGQTTTNPGPYIDVDESPGMEWGTCMVFSCRDDCRIDAVTSRKEVAECWREEFVLVQWE
ncbi:hypothetical protein FRB93_006883 [Tulasnella sp. JGI-2019a]|nr:hypothetical protein FRB93_006883 [Tulasnella sp. JGI-2019a]